MRTLLAGLAALSLGLATCLGASAQAGNQDRDQERNPTQKRERDRGDRAGQGERKVVRGVIAGVTAEGELAIDYRTQHAAIAEMTYLTVVGSERPQGRLRREGAARKGDQGDRDDGDRQASSDRQRQNVYVVWLTPRTVIRNASERRDTRDRDERSATRKDGEDDAKDQDQDKDQGPRTKDKEGEAADSLTADILEVGDRVEVRFLQRSERGGDRARNAASRKHGRHRTYYGEAVAITILSEPAQDERDAGSNRNRNRERDRDRERDQGKQDNNRSNDRDQ